MQPRDFIETARVLTRRAGSGRPRETDLRRAVSTAYYAMFHCLALCCADALAGKTSANRSRRAWLQTYRALEHRDARKRCEGPRIREFPDAIQEFARQFVNMQGLRHHADYNPAKSFALSEVIQEIDATEEIIGEFAKAPANDRRAFAVYALLPLRTG